MRKLDVDQITIHGSTNNYVLGTDFSSNNLLYVSFSQLPFERIKRASLYLRINNPSNNYSNYWDHMIGIKVNTGTTIQYDQCIIEEYAGFIKYLKLDCTDLLGITHSVSQTTKTLQVYLVNNYSANLTILTSQSFLRVEFDEPFDYLPKQKLYSNRLGELMTYEVDYLTFNTYVSKKLFDDALNLDFSLVYDYVYPENVAFNHFPKGWKLNILEKIIIPSSTSDITLIDNKYNRRIFKKITNQNYYYDITGSGQILQKVGSSYKLYSPLSSAYKFFNSSGNLVAIVLENGDEIVITYSTNTITITDYLGVTVTVDSSNSELTTISNSVTNQVYNLNVNSSGLLSSISFYKLSSNSLTSSDSFSYHGTTKRLRDISTFDNYQLNLYNSLNNLEITSSADDEPHSIVKFTFDVNSVFIENLCNGYKERLFFDENKNILISGKDTGLINDSDQLVYLEKLFGHSAYSFSDSNIVNVSFQTVDTNYVTIQTDSNGDDGYALTNPISIGAGDYLVLVKVKPVVRSQSSINNSNKSVYLTIPNVYGINKLLTFNSFKEEYQAIKFSLLGNYNNFFLRFETNQISSSFNITNLYLLKLQSKNQQILFDNGAFSGFQNANSNSFSELKSLTYQPTSSQTYYLFSSDIFINQLIKYKFGYYKFFFTNDLKNLFLFDQNTIPSVIYNGNSTPISYSNLSFIQKNAQSISNLEYIGITSASTTSQYVLSLMKIHVNNDILNSLSYYFGSVVYDYHGNVLSRTDYNGITTTNTYNYHLDLTNSYFSNGNNYIKSTYQYDSYHRLNVESQLIGNQTSQTQYQYSSNYLKFIRGVTDGNNKSLFYSYSPRFEYLKTISKSITPNNNSPFVQSSKNVEYKMDNISSNIGDYQLQYNYYLRRLTNITYHHERLLDDGSQTVNYSASLISVTYYQYQDGDYTEVIKYGNNFYQYTKEYDTFHRLWYINFGNNAHATLTYNEESPNAKLTSIIDTSSYNNETINFSYYKGKIASYSVQNDSYNLLISYNYDLDNRFYQKEESLSQNNNLINGISKIKTTYSFSPCDDSLVSYSLDLYLTFNNTAVLYKTVTMNLTKDNLSRLSSKTITIDNSSIGFSHINYFQLNDGRTSNQISSMQYAFNNQTDSFSYDKVGNILSVTNGNNVITYEYDNVYQLVKESHSQDDYYIQYSYDLGGNITSATKKKISDDTTLESHTYEYDPDITFKLTKYNNVSITYDNFLNPLSLNGATLTYYRGNKLRTYTKNNTTHTYYYSSAGLRTYKSSISQNVRYFYESNRLTKELRTSNNTTHLLTYLYGENGVIGFTYDNEIYLYEKDMFNNVIALYFLENNSLSLVAKYVYDAYGNHRVLDSQDEDYTGVMSFIGNINPIRYRSYYFDAESGFYYCKARYYVPYLRRWLTMDSLSYLDNKDMHGTNLFIYCHNNPVMYVDENGHISDIIIAMLIGAAVGAALSAATYAASEAISYSITGEWTWSWGQFIGSVFAGTISGAFSFAFPETSIALIASSVSAGLGTALSMTLQNGFEGADYTPWQIAISGIMSGLVTYGLLKFLDYVNINCCELFWHNSTGFIDSTIVQVNKYSVSTMLAKYARVDIFENLIQILFDGLNDAFDKNDLVNNCFGAKK